MAGPIVKLKHADGTEVTAQEAYDAFMKTRVLIVKDGTTYEVVNMVWYDTNSVQTEPTNVGYVKLSWVENSNSAVVFGSISVGNSSLVPA